MVLMELFLHMDKQELVKRILILFSYTMGLLESNLNISSNGLIPLMLNYLFNYIDNSKDKNIKYVVSLSFIQIYMDNIEDLLGETIEKNKINEYQVNSLQSSYDILNIGLRKRIIKSTTMNTQSSRSHTILTINLKKVLFLF